jgi:plasmid stability protein
MASITIRNLDDELKRRLRIRSAEHGRSMEDEARDILRTNLCREDHPPANLANTIRRRFASIGNTELPIPPREPIHEPPDFES